MRKKCSLTEDEWFKRLTPEQYRVLRQHATERAFSGSYWDTKTPGEYHCAGCGALLFSSENKYDSGSGWPSFWQPTEAEAVMYFPDHLLGYERTEIRCSACGSHLGHVFDDGPKPTGKRYCVNSTSLELRPRSKE